MITERKLFHDDETLPEQSRRILREAIDQVKPIAVVGLVSGGKDSITMLHVCRDQLTHIGMANTTIGSEHTRDFVRGLAHDLYVPFIEAFPPDSYEEIVLMNGFPGAGDMAHRIMFNRLKQRAFRVIRRILQAETPGEVMFVSGVRRDESPTRRRRGRVRVLAKDDDAWWCAPLAEWKTLDLLAYMRQHDLRVGPVSQRIGISGECECGSKARWLELEDIRQADPDLADYIDELERKVTAAGIPAPYNRWGWGASSSHRKPRVHEEQASLEEFDPAFLCGGSCARSA